MSPAEEPSLYHKFHATVYLDTGDLIIRRGTLMTFFCSTGMSPCVFARIFFSGTSDVVVKPRYLKGKIEANVEIYLQKTMFVDTFANDETFGHFFLRCEKKTIGRGIITELRA